MLGRSCTLTASAFCLKLPARCVNLPCSSSGRKSLSPSTEASIATHDCSPWPQDLPGLSSQHGAEIRESVEKDMTDEAMRADPRAASVIAPGARAKRKARVPDAVAEEQGARRGVCVHVFVVCKGM